MSDVLCPHCGQPHPVEVATCPTTGRPVRAASPGLPLPDGRQPPPAPVAAVTAVPPPPPPPPAAAAATSESTRSTSTTPDKGVADILKEAYDLYRKHARMLLMTCAIVFVPASMVSSCARAVILPSTVVGVETGMMSNLGHAVLGWLGTLVTSTLMFGIAVQLTNGALTIAAADRVLGGDAGWREVWKLLLRRLGPLLSALLPAALMVGIGTLFFLIPGIVLGLLFAFVSPVVLVEGLRGRAALRRSFELVESDWLRVAIVILVFSVLSWLARMVAGILIPKTAIFALSLFSDLFTLVLMPWPVLGLVLLYFDVRRKRDGFTPDRLRADLEALKTG